MNAPLPTPAPTPLLIECECNEGRWYASSRDERGTPCRTCHATGQVPALCHECKAPIVGAYEEGVDVAPDALGRVRRVQTFTCERCAEWVRENESEVACG